MNITLSLWMAMTVLLFAVTPVWGLDLNEELPSVRILEFYPKNIVTLNRGLEDGVAVGSHAKLRSSEGFAARALCVKVGMLTSQWRLYRVVDSELVSKDFTYTLVGMDGSQAPELVERWQKIDHSKTIPEFDEKKLMAPEAQASTGAPVTPVTPDLPETLEKDPGFNPSKPLTAQIIERAYDPEKLRRDFQKVRMSLFAAPWSVQRGGNTEIENSRFGGSVVNEGTKYGLQMRLDRSVVSAKEMDTKEKVQSSLTEVQGTFSVKQITPMMDVYSDLTYRTASYGELETPKHHYLLAPIGFTRHFGEGATLKKSFLSYAPTYDTRTHEVATINGAASEKTVSGLRHAVRMYLHLQVNPTFSIASDTHWRPAQDLSTWAVALDDSLMQERLTLSWKLISKLHLDYELNWLDDAQLRRLNSLPRVVTTNSLNVRLDFDL
ncbi:MAG: hypothetical protein ACLGG7_01140 [Bacteriovoracia bacterium]